MKRLAILLAVAALTSGCGLRPVYSGGSSGPTATFLSSVTVQPIDGGRVGWLLRAALADRLGDPAQGDRRYRLEVEVDDDLTSFGIRGDTAVTRERRTIRARYRLVDNATGQVVLDATAGSDAGIDVVSSDVATLAAEQTAAERLAQVVADQIVARLGLYAGRGGRR
ncbi:LPS assembly lipoprotein LptE [Sphingomonas glaciei]|uniref:LPS assembly lipoprotein LptE n=1 Tax=Sphingomonas glaciei TaxID=2938948 RepID=A0ABY5MUA8_9SPHN|nr:LPS assembly lipoprotein LptE [Sphingomonas glaciei]UUR07305.1 LPS assembly lipoprotein LptE [Sphingomonas glaciei]